jgi:hypothetical protein
MFTRIIYEEGQGEFIERFLNNIKIISGFEDFVHSLIKNIEFIALVKEFRYKSSSLKNCQQKLSNLSVIHL